MRTTAESTCGGGTKTPRGTAKATSTVAQVCKSTWETKQQYVDELNLVPKAQEAVAQLHNLPAETAIDPDAGWLLRSLFRDDVERQPVTAGVLRRDLQTLTQKPLAQALRLTAEKLEVDARGIRDDYLAGLAEFRKYWTDECGQANVDYVPMDTSVGFDKALMEYLVQRTRRFS